MPTPILMPALSPTMEKGNLAKWLKQEGERIKSGDIIAEIETDKATMEVEAVDEGILAKILIPAGSADVAVNQVIALIAGEGEDAKTIAANGGKAPVAAPVAAAAAASMPAATPAAAVATAAPAPAAPANGTRVFASPLARRIARDAAIDLAALKGSGPHGRIVAKDVEAAKVSGVKTVASTATAPQQLASSADAPAKPAAAPIAGLADDKVRAMFAADSFEVVPHDSMRKTIARRLLESKLTVPHFYLTSDCEIDALLKLREQIKASAPTGKDGKPAFKLSVNDMVIKALAMALRAVPDANVSWTESAMLRHRQADVGVAVSIPGGLITPVVRSACQKTLSAISNEVKDMAARAKVRKLKPEEYQGGTTAVSNLGMFGVKDFSAVINPPHATILAVGAGEQRPVVKNGALAIATVMSVTLSCDHRAVDGALGAELLQAFKGFVEKPLGMLV